MERMPIKLLTVLAVFALMLAACGGDDGAGTQAPDVGAADFNGDGVVRIGVATDGARDDGAYYQALVERVEQISAEYGFEPPIVVDQIDPANSRAELENLAVQGVDIIAIGSEAVARDNEDLFTTYDEIFWYCNCGSGYQDTPGVLRSADSGAELNISAGYAAGLLLQERGGDSVAFLGCCDLPFEFESFWGFQFGLSQVDESFTATYVPTGNFPYDFNNTAGATEAYNNAVAEGADAVYPFLGGAHEPIVALANEDGLIVNTAGSSKGCERDDLTYDFEVMFDAGDYLEPLFAEILAGTALEGTARYFTVGIDPQVGATFCNATPEQVQLLADYNARIGAGDFGEKIDEILSEAYGL
jgi:basic membrane protein A